MAEPIVEEPTLIDHSVVPDAFDFLFDKSDPPAPDPDPDIIRTDPDTTPLDSILNPSDPDITGTDPEPDNLADPEKDSGLPRQLREELAARKAKIAEMEAREKDLVPKQELETLREQYTTTAQELEAFRARQVEIDPTQDPEVVRLLDDWNKTVEKEAILVGRRPQEFKQEVATFIQKFHALDSSDPAFRDQFLAVNKEASDFFGEDFEAVKPTLKQGVSAFQDMETEVARAREEGAARQFERATSDYAANLRAAKDLIQKGITDEAARARPFSVEGAIYAATEADPVFKKNFEMAQAYVEETVSGLPPHNPNDSRWVGKTPEQIEQAILEERKIFDRKVEAYPVVAAKGLGAQMLLPAALKKIADLEAKLASRAGDIPPPPEPDGGPGDSAKPEYIVNPDSKHNTPSSLLAAMGG